ncbi:PPOX class F420-dependent oxidoreductase [Nocardia sp. NPDC127579]|uniref:PPOX class F420-dependent oxidoreductase n=1 Tax=Nocardia sp. NPDC127579 TaxID=3345402 RepID=UPI00363194DE
MPTTAAELTPAAGEFLTERHLATLTTLRPDGTPHVVAVGFTWDSEAGIARIITDTATTKARNVRRTGYAAVSQVDGARFLTLEGPATVLDDPAAVLAAETRYTARYKPPRVNPTRVVIAIQVSRVLSSRGLRSA